MGELLEMQRGYSDIKLHKAQKKIIFCLNCGKEEQVREKLNRKFCSKTCAAKWYHRNHPEKFKFKMSEESRRKISNAQKGIPEKEWVKKQTSEIIKQLYIDRPELKQKARDAWLNPEYRRKQEFARKNQKLFDTAPELKVKEALENLGICYESQKLIRGKPDFFLPRYNIVIMCDGDYWHGNPSKYKFDDIIKSPKSSAKTVHQVWTRDEEITKDLESQGYIVLRFWESDINCDFAGVRKTISETINRVETIL